MAKVASVFSWSTTSRTLPTFFASGFAREARDGTYVMHFSNSGENALQLPGGEIEPRLILILSDINMPGMDGLQLLGEIKQRFPDLPVMMVNAHGDDERRRRASDLGAEDSSPSRSISIG